MREHRFPGTAYDIYRKSLLLRFTQKLAPRYNMTFASVEIRNHFLSGTFNSSRSCDALLIALSCIFFSTILQKDLFSLYIF